MKIQLQFRCCVTPERCSRFASHVTQMLLVRAAPILTKDAELDCVEWAGITSNPRTIPELVTDLHCFLSVNTAGELH